MISYLNKCICAFVLCIGSHKQARGGYGTSGVKENIFLTYEQVMKIFSLPTCSTIHISCLACAGRYDR